MKKVMTYICIENSSSRLQLINICEFIIKFIFTGSNIELVCSDFTLVNLTYFVIHDVHYNYYHGCNKKMAEYISLT